MAEDLRPLLEAAEAAGVNRNTLARWVRGGRLSCQLGEDGTRLVKLVSVAKAKELAGEITRGRTKQPAPKPKARKGKK